MDWNAQHIRFNLFDPKGANCGTIIILADDAVNFLQRSWKGDINWNGRIPGYILNAPNQCADFSS